MFIVIPNHDWCMSLDPDTRTWLFLIEFGLGTLIAGALWTAWMLKAIELTER